MFPLLCLLNAFFVQKEDALRREENLEEAKKVEMVEDETLPKPVEVRNMMQCLHCSR